MKKIVIKVNGIPMNYHQASKYLSHQEKVELKKKLREIKDARKRGTK